VDMMSTKPVEDALQQFKQLVEELGEVARDLKSKQTKNTQANEAAAVPDATTNHFTNLSASELADALKTMDGTFVLATTNEDGTPNAAIFVPRMSDEEHLYMFLANNRSLANLKRTGRAWGIYERINHNATENKEHFAGARMALSLVDPTRDAAEFKAATANLAKIPPAIVVLRIDRLIALG
ncbi:MAG: hypothetical protein U0O24_04075, partial [Eggerthellaceae bacterium]